MIKTSCLFVVALVTSSVTVQPALPAQRQDRTSKPIKVILKVDLEGPEGLQVQDAKDLSSAELARLRSLIQAEIAKLPDHVLVPPDEKGDALGVIVVAGKYPNGPNAVILLSSVITLAKAGGTDEVFVSHDVIAATSLARAARAVAFYLTSVELRYILISRLLR